MPALEQTAWNTHDFRTKMLDWSAARGSRLAFSCRFCGRVFYSFTILRGGPWAVDAKGRYLEDAVTDRWLLEKCPRTFGPQDEEDRLRLAKE